MRRLSWLMLATHVPTSGAGGGMVRYVVELTRALAARPDVDLFVLASPGSRPVFADLIGDDDRVGEAPPGPTVVRSALEREGWGSAFLRRRFDVVHGTKHLVPRRTSGRRVLTVHDMLMIDLPKDFGFAKRTFLKRPYLASLRQAETLLCVSAATRQRMLEYVPTASERAQVVPLAASSSLLHADAQPVPELLGRQFALVVGDSSPRKNLSFVVDLWPELVARHPGALLAVVGPPSWGASDRGQLYGNLAANGDLIPLGQVSDSTLQWCYRHATVTLCPSRAEGFGLPAVEALAFGSPLITSTDPALCEVSGSRALHLSTTDQTAWVSAIAAVFGRVTQGRPVPDETPRSWHDVAAETVAAVRTTR